MIKVSVLIAVYNGEKYLPECLDSLISQTLKEIEVICVDDGSEDNSYKILTEYAEKDERIKVIRLSENTGLAYARNIGLDKASGEYICFLDSDDWYANDSLERCSKVLDNNPDADTALFRLMMYYGKDKCSEYPMEYFEKITGKEAFCKCLDWDIHGVYMMRASLQKKHPYDDSLKAYSDDNTSRIHYLVSRNVCCTDAPYYYRQHKSSVTHAVTPRRFDYIRATDSLKQQLTELKESKEILNKYENIRWMVLIDTYFFYYVNRKKLKKEDARFGLQEIHRVWKEIDYSVLDSRASKFGYHPCGSWLMFRIQEEIYFTLRSLLGKNENK